MSRKDIKIGLFGFGCVGYGLYEVLQKTPALRASIKHICVKNPDKSRPIDASHFIYDKDIILQDPEVNVIVELIDDAEAAYDIVRSALIQGKAVVSANKKMIAEHFEELWQLQNLHQVPLLYEAACCASLPIIRNLEEYYNNDLLESFEGIVNGSTNYILTQTTQKAISYQEALSDAQNKGYAESNPILDTGGFDAKFKLQILLAHAFGIITKPEEIYHDGIQNLGQVELNYAREKGYKIKLVAQAYKNENGYISSFVLPTFIPSDHPLYNVDDVFNGIITQTSFADKQFFVGKGAGAHPTASAVLSDISALCYDYKYEYKKINNQEKLSLDSDIKLRVLLRFDPQLDPNPESYFEEITESFKAKNNAYIIGDIRIETLKKIKALFPESHSIVLIKTL